MDDITLDLFNNIATALKELASIVDQLETRIRILESIEQRTYTNGELEKIMLDLGFKQ